MYISGGHKNRRLLLAAAVYLLVTLLCIAFHGIYARFSYGEDSPFLAWMWLLPLSGGMAPSLGLLLAGRAERLNRSAFNLWNSGIAALIFGCLVRGIVNVSGRFTAYDRVYWATGGALLLAALLAGTAGGLFHTTGKAP